MIVSITDSYGETIKLTNVTKIFTSTVYDDVICVQVDGEPLMRFSLNEINYMEVLR